MQDNRIDYLDTLKGVGMLMVVLWHIDVFNVPWINGLWMPMFFVISGLFFKSSNNPKQYILKKTNGILVPFLTFYILSYIAFYLCNWLAPNIIRISASGILDIFTQKQYFNGPIWFLLSLFIVSLMMYYISSLKLRESVRCGIVCFIGLIGYSLGMTKIVLPLTLDSSFSMLPFFYVGILMKKYSIHKYLKGSFLNHLVLSIFFLFGIALMIIFDYTELNARDNHHVGPTLISYMFYLCTICFLMSILSKSRSIPFLTYFGRYSLIPLCLHHLIYRPVILMEKLLFNNDNSYITAILTIGICLIAIPFCKKYVPWFVGYKPISSLKIHHNRKVELCD